MALYLDDVSALPLIVICNILSTIFRLSNRDFVDEIYSITE